MKPTPAGTLSSDQVIVPPIGLNTKLSPFPKEAGLVLPVKRTEEGNDAVTVIFEAALEELVSVQITVYAVSLSALGGNGPLFEIGPAKYTTRGASSKSEAIFIVRSVDD